MGIKHALLVLGGLLWVSHFYPLKIAVVVMFNSPASRAMYLHEILSLYFPFSLNGIEPLASCLYIHAQILATTIKGLRNEGKISRNPAYIIKVLCFLGQICD